MLQIKRSELEQLAQNKLGNDSLESQNKILVMISTSLAARTSYTVVGDEKEIDYSKMIELHDRLISQNPPHSSPLEHCARVMSHEEYKAFIKGEGQKREDGYYKSVCGNALFNISAHGWCGPYKGFMSYRYFIDNGKNK